MKFQSKFNQIAPTQSRPLESAIFPDHPHPTMLIEGGQEPGDETGWKSVEIKKISERGINKGKYKTKQRELDQVGQCIDWLSIDDVAAFDDRIFERSFAKGLPDLILYAPYDEGFRSVIPRLGWTRRDRQSAVIHVASVRDLCRSVSASFQTTTNNFTTKEVPL
ncbi:MAG: hypothetical protein B7Y39_09920 [Bdellovibrio sp. 28-41-41]|nr:MAG: hypothetical protein B7Y39_09920 [Bdellovibrio sp. 28-41-41]